MVTKASPRSRALSPADFFAGLIANLAPLLPLDLRGFVQLRRGRLLKLHYGRPQTHFEVWHHPNTGRLEIGLHLEGAPALNLAAFGYLRSRMIEIKADLPRAELEPWDRGWCRLYQTIPAAELDGVVAGMAASTLGAYVTTLQPILNMFWEESRR